MKHNVIIVGAGQGARLGDSLPKAFVSLGGRPIYQHSLGTFQSHPQIGEIVFVVPPEGPPVSLEKVKVVPGGSTRQESVACGLEALNTQYATVLVHDAARPFVSASLIDRLLAWLAKGENAIAAWPCSDTVKQTSGNRIIKTLDRSRLAGAQTPQAFQRETLQAVLRRAKQEGWQGTDEAQLLEKMGKPVYWVAGDPLNIKITTPADLKLAEIIYENRSRL